MAPSGLTGLVAALIGFTAVNASPLSQFHKHSLFHSHPLARIAAPAFSPIEPGPVQSLHPVLARVPGWGTGTTYNLVDNYEPSNFFSMFDFFTVWFPKM